MHRNISVSLHMCLLSAVVFSFVQSSLAGIRPAFLLDYCSWHATDIVLVEVTPKPGVLRVMEPWKGGLKAGHLVTVSNCNHPLARWRLLATQESSMTS
jgi:hypothetical protein